VFIAVVCALAGIGFLSATIQINGRALSFVQRPAAAQVVDVQAPIFNDGAGGTIQPDR